MNDSVVSGLSSAYRASQVGAWVDGGESVGSIDRIVSVLETGHQGSTRWLGGCTLLPQPGRRRVRALVPLLRLEPVVVLAYL